MFVDTAKIRIKAGDGGNGACTFHREKYVNAESGEVSEERVAELLTEIKKDIADQAPATKEEVQQIVEDQLSRFEINLSEQDRQLLVDLMDRIRNLDINFSQWSEQLSDLSKTIEEKFGSISDLVQDEGFWEGVKNFFRNLIDTISSWFGSGDDTQTE